MDWSWRKTATGTHCFNIKLGESYNVSVPQCTMFTCCGSYCHIYIYVPLGWWFSRSYYQFRVLIADPRALFHVYAIPSIVLRVPRILIISVCREELIAELRTGPRAISSDLCNGSEWFSPQTPRISVLLLHQRVDLLVYNWLLVS